MKPASRRRKYILGVGVGVALFSASSVAPAMAAPPGSMVTDDVSTVTAALDQHGLLTPSTERSGVLQKDISSSDLAPELHSSVRSDAGLTVPTTEGTMTIAPVNGIGSPTSDGWLSYDGNDHSVAATTTASGTANALYAVIENADAPSEYRFDVTASGSPAGLTLHEGAVLVRDSQGVQVNAILPAWAVDANGTQVPTHYEIEGSTLVQVVDHVGSAYPVVADPAAACDSLSCTMFFSKSETLTASESGAAATAVVCGGAALINPPAGFGCGVYGTVVTITATQAKNSGQCVAFRTSNFGLYTPHAFIYNDANCR